MRYNNMKGRLGRRRKLNLRQRIVRKRRIVPYGIELHEGLKRIGR